ncbi:MAG: bifunctional isocitrate dehydrogenase kinase/phosphatase, partial [Sinobacteraceae bacterium]|nr:bifunctional isocitrate dehydrogenase kinase/phosphatase [Nevskiaceae bacterium]
MDIAAAPRRSSPQVEKTYELLRSCPSEAERVTKMAKLILAIYDEFYAQLCEYPYRAKRAFETMDTHASIRISKERLELYSRYIAEHGPRILAAWPALANNATFWEAFDRVFVAMI